MTEIYKECLRVLKPGAHGLVWALPRTSHWTATALENAGFSVRDVISHPGAAAQRLGFGFVGIEKEVEYFEIAAKRMKAINEL